MRALLVHIVAFGGQKIEDIINTPSSVRNAAQKWDRDHPKEAAERAEKQLGVYGEAARKVDSWHEWFRVDPRAPFSCLTK
jgi:hypothetical protein